MAPCVLGKAWIVTVHVLLLERALASPTGGTHSLRHHRFDAFQNETVLLDEASIAKCAQAYVEDCGATGECCDPVMTCYEKHAKWAACLPSCTPGFQPWVDWFWHWTPWTCMPIVDSIARDELGIEFHHSDATPLRASAGPHRYQVFVNKSSETGSPIYDGMEQTRLTFVKSANECKALCDNDRRCDCFMYSNSTQHCDKRRACAPTVHDLKDAVGKSFYLKEPHEETSSVSWKEFPHSNLFYSTGLRIDDEDYGASTLKSCKRRCEISKSCQCLRYAKVFARCERYTDCSNTDLIEDELYDVYIKELPMLQEPQDIAWWFVLRLVVLVLLLLLLCCLLLVFLRRKKDPQPEYVPLLPTQTRLDMFADAALVDRWPGGCADCGVACGRPPAWVPRSGAVVVTEACQSNVRGRPDDGLMPGDVLLNIRRNGRTVSAIHCTDDVKEAVRTCQVGEIIDLEVLRVRGDWNSRPLPPDEVPLIQASMDSPAEVEKAALPTHKKVCVQRLVE